MGLLGGIVGDIVGSRFEFDNCRSRGFEFWEAWSWCTDDSVVAIAVANAVLKGLDIKDELKRVCRNNKNLSYGKRFRQWFMSDEQYSYDSCGNGALSRVCGLIDVCESFDSMLQKGKESCKCSHNHPESYKAVECFLSCMWMARDGKDKERIKKFVEDSFYKLDFNYDELVCNYKFDETCQGCLPQAIFCFLISNDFEDAIRTAISIGGDSDSIACIVGAIAEEFYGIPEWIKSKIPYYLEDLCLENIDIKKVDKIDKFWYIEDVATKEK